LDIKDEIPEARFSDISAELDWKDGWILKAGVDYWLNEKVSLRGGYTYLETVVPDRTLSPANPDSEQHVFSIGMSYRMGKMYLDGFYSAGFYEDRKVQNDILSGKYENFAHYVGFSIGYQWFGHMNKEGPNIPN
jgi:long-chain fatty acid transport protein